MSLNVRSISGLLKMKYSFTWSLRSKSPAAPSRYHGPLSLWAFRSSRWLRGYAAPSIRPPQSSPWQEVVLLPDLQHLLCQYFNLEVQTLDCKLERERERQRANDYPSFSWPAIIPFCFWANKSQSTLTIDRGLRSKVHLVQLGNCKALIHLFWVLC